MVNRLGDTGCALHISNRQREQGEMGRHSAELPPRARRGRRFLMPTKTQPMLVVAWGEQKSLEPGRDAMFRCIVIDFFSCIRRNKM